MAGSRKTWADLGLEHWSSTNDVSDEKTYVYQYMSADNKNNIQFEFFLLDEASKESVIEGINDMQLKPNGLVANNTTKHQVSSAGIYITSATMNKVSNDLTIQEEGMLGRNFDTQKEDFAKAELAYDNVTNSFTAVFESIDGTGSGTMTYETASLTNLADMKKEAAFSEQYITSKIVQSILSQKTGTELKDITTVLGTGKVTATGGFTETYTTDASTIKTGNLKSGTFAAASIDFSGLGTDFQLYDLLSTGFDSTCMTCSNHYSVMFVYGGTTDVTQSNGYGFQKTEVGDDHYLQIDLKTMMEKGISSGAEFTKALVEIFDESGFDYHYTQYATDDSGNLYICDNRPEYAGEDYARQAKFYIEPYNVNDVTIDLKLQNTSDNRYMNMTYTYNVFEELQDDIEADLVVEDTNGKYVQDSAGNWILYDAADYYDANGNPLPGITIPQHRYNIEVVNSIDWEAAYDSIMGDIADNTEFLVTSTDYAYIDCKTNENPNEAYVSTFRFASEEEEDNGMWIQAGANQFQGMYMKWDGFSSRYLGLMSHDMTTREGASQLITKVDIAICKISSIRSAFGAYTNRLEKMYAMNQNYEENMQSAESKIRDADMALEMVQMSKYNILQQAGQSMLAQVNRSMQGILSLLQS